MFDQCFLGAVYVCVQSMLPAVLTQHICISEFKVSFAGAAHVCVQCLINVSPVPNVTLHRKKKHRKRNSKVAASLSLFATAGNITNVYKYKCLQSLCVPVDVYCKQASGLHLSLRAY